MSPLPKELPIKGRKDFRNGLLFIGSISGLVAFNAAQSGDGQTFLISAAIAALLIYAAIKVKTKKKLVSKAGLYK